jgi:hypothetical protein
LLLLANVSAPYQTVGFPYAGMFVPGERRNPGLSFLSFIVKSGRALMFPVYKGTHERYVPAGGEKETSGARDLEVEDYKELARSLDYIETRPDLGHQQLEHLKKTRNTGCSTPDTSPRATTLFARG